MVICFLFAGAIYINGGKIELTSCTFTGNFGGADDVRIGGAFAGGGQQPILKDCKFTAHMVLRHHACGTVFIVSLGSVRGANNDHKMSTK